MLARWPVARPSFAPEYRALSFARVRIPPWYPPRRRPDDGGASGIVSPFGEMTESGVDNQNANGFSRNDDVDVYLGCFAEAQFQLAWQAELAFFRVEMPSYEGPPSWAAYDRWVQDVLTPWVQYRMEHLHETLPESFSHAANAHVPQWEIASYYALRRAFRRFACEIRMGTPPPFAGPDWLDHLGRPRPARCDE